MPFCEKSISLGTSTYHSVKRAVLSPYFEILYMSSFQISKDGAGSKLSDLSTKNTCQQVAAGSEEEVRGSEMITLDLWTNPCQQVASDSIIVETTEEFVKVYLMCNAPSDPSVKEHVPAGGDGFERFENGWRDNRRACASMLRRMLRKGSETCC